MSARGLLKLAALPAVLGLSPAFAQGETQVVQTTETQSVSTTTITAAPAAAVATDEGWNRRWALLFSVNNVFTSSSILTAPVTGTIGASYFLTDTTAIRTGINLLRITNPVQVSKVKTTTGASDVTTYEVTVPGGFTSVHAVDLRADVLKRLSRSAVAPYLGVGASAGWAWNRTSYLDAESVVDQRTEIDNNASNFRVTARGIVGAEWRVHPSFALYADYTLAVDVWSRDRIRYRTTVESTAGGAPTTAQTERQSDTNRWLNVRTGTDQAASLGLQVFF